MTPKKVKRVPPSKTDVLVVEDSPEAMLIYLATVRDMGLTAHPATNGLIALQAIQNGIRPKCVLLDLIMPVMNGLAFYNHSQKFPSMRKVPFILTSSDPLAADIVEALDLFGHVPKSARATGIEKLILNAVKKPRL